MAIAFADAEARYAEMSARLGRAYVIPREDVPRILTGELSAADVKREAMTRMTTFVSCLTDTYGLHQWEKRKMLLGLLARPTLVMQAAAHLDDPEVLAEVIERALEAGGAHDTRQEGTAIHAWGERVDRGDFTSEDFQLVPDAYKPDVLAHRNAMLGLHFERIESRVVLDDYGVTGTPDRVLRFPVEGEPYYAEACWHPDPASGGLVRTCTPDGRPVDGRVFVGDTKSGKVDNGRVLKMAMQFAGYSRAEHYAEETGERLPLSTSGEVDQDYAILIHTPAGQGVCELSWIDIREGWKWFNECVKVRESRKIGMRHLLTPLHEPKPSEEELELEVVPGSGDQPMSALAAVEALEDESSRDPEPVAVIANSPDFSEILEQASRDLLGSSPADEPEVKGDPFVEDVASVAGALGRKAERAQGALTERAAQPVEPAPLGGVMVPGPDPDAPRPMAHMRAKADEPGRMGETEQVYGDQIRSDVNDAINLELDENTRQLERALKRVTAQTARTPRRAAVIEARKKRGASETLPIDPKDYTSEDLHDLIEWVDTMVALAHIIRVYGRGEEVYAGNGRSRWTGRNVLTQAHMNHARQRRVDIATERKAQHAGEDKPL